MEEKVGPIRVISTTEELRKVLRYWCKKIYQAMDLNKADLDKALKRINKLISIQWNVVEVIPNVFFETYVLGDWGHAFYDQPVRKAWGGYCFGMRDHFAVLHNGDVTLCCVDFEGRTAFGNLHHESLKEVLCKEELGKIMEGFRQFRLVHPFCKYCLGGKNIFSWLTKPITTIFSLYALKPYFYHRTRLFDHL